MDTTRDRLLALADRWQDEADAATSRYFRSEPVVLRYCSNDLRELAGPEPVEPEPFRLSEADKDRLWAAWRESGGIAFSDSSFWTAVETLVTERLVPGTGRVEVDPENCGCAPAGQPQASDACGIIGDHVPPTSPKCVEGCAMVEPYGWTVAAGCRRHDVAGVA
jgi:hypothetical protein